MFVFALLTAALFVCSSARSHHHHHHHHLHHHEEEVEKKKEFECPFTDSEGKPCKRNQFHIDMNENLNLRPDIDYGNTTKEITDIELLCCYEVDCLEECGISYDDIDNHQAQKLPGIGFELIRKYPAFFNNRSRDALDRYSKETEPVKDDWRIILLHFFTARGAWEEAKQKVEKLDKWFA